MNDYQVNINLSLSNIKKALSELDRQVANLGKGASLRQLVSQSAQIRDNLKSAIQTFSKGGVDASKQFQKGFQSITSSANQFQKGLTAINNQLAVTRQGMALVQSAGKATGTVLSSIGVKSTLGTVFGQLKQNVQQTLPFLGKLSTGFKTVGANVATFAVNNAIPGAINRWNRALGDWNNSIKGNISLLGSWWNHFGRIAIGFTVAYRAMNAFEALLRKTSETIRGAIKESGEFATLQGKLAMFTTLASKGAIGFDKAFKQSGQVVNSLAQASVRSISSVEELSVAMDELSQAGVLIPPNLTKEFVSFADFTSLISQTTGDNVRQLRSEINGLMEGQTRANNTLIRTMKNFGIITADQISNLREMHGRAEAVEIIMKKIHEVWTQFVDKAIASNPALAFQVWEKSIRRTMLTAINLTSEAQGKFNLFGDTLKKHIDRWNQAFSGDMRNNTAVKQMAVTMDLLNRAFDTALTAFEKVILGVTQIATAFTNLDDSVKKVLKIMLLWEVSVIAFKGIKILSQAFIVLNAGIVTAITRFGLFPTVMIATAAAVFLVNSAFEVFKGQSKTAQEKVDELTTSVNNLKEAFTNLKFTIAGAFLGFKLGGTTGGLIGAGIGLLTDLIYDTNRDKGNTDKILKQLEEQKAQIVKRMNEVYAEYEKAANAGNKQLADSKQRSFQNLVDINKQLAERIRDIKFTLSGENEKTESSFVAKWFNQTMENLSLLVDAGFKELQPIMNKISDWWKKVSLPKIDLTSKLGGTVDPFEQIVKKAEVDLKELDKEIGNISSNIYEKFIKAVEAGKTATAELFKVPAQMELTAEIRELTDKLKLMETRLAWTKEGTTEWYRFKAAIAGTNSSIEELRTQLSQIDYKAQLAPAIAITKKLEDELEQLKIKMVEGTPEYLAALAEIKSRYADAFKDITISSDDFKQMDAFTKYKDNMKEITDATGGWKEGLRKGFDELRKVTVMDDVKSFTVSAFRSMEDAIVSFTSKGKAAFTDMIESMLNDLLRLIVRMQVIQPLAQLLNTSLFSTSSATIGTAGEGSTFWDSGFAFAEGGKINEHVVGVGLASGKRYDIGEAGETEYVTPASKMGGNTQINIINNTPAQISTKESFANGQKRIDVTIDEINATKLAGSSRSAQILRNVWGLKPALAGR